MDILDVLYTINSGYIDIMLGSIYSLVLNSGIPKIRLHIIVSDFSFEDYKKVETALANFPNIEYYFYDLNSFDIEKFQIPNWRGSQIANARLFFQRIMLDSTLSSISNLLYLDADTLVVSSLEGLEDYQDFTINAVRENGPKDNSRRLNLKGNYYNSGVIFYNIANWLDQGLEEKIVHFLENTTLPIVFPDQDILNVALKDEINPMPLSYNLTANNALFGPLGDALYFGNENIVGTFEEVQAAKKDAKILHCNGLFDIKPWSNNHLNPYNEIYMEYIRMANPDFKKTDLEGIQYVLSKFPHLTKMGVIISSYFPDKTQNYVRKLLTKVTKR